MNQIPEHRVYWRENWSDDWTLEPYLYADQFTFACAPTIPSATLFYKAGEKIMRPDKTTFESYPPLDLQDFFIKIELDHSAEDDPTPRKWIGLCVETTAELAGNDGIVTPLERQQFQCLGMEHLLTKKTIDTSVVMRSDGEATIARAIGFNLGAGNDQDADKIPNASGQIFGGGTMGQFGVPIFASSLVNATDYDNTATYSWTAYDIINYLSYYHLPGDANGNSVFDFFVDFQGAAKNLQYYEPAIRVQERSLYEILCMLIDRRRGLTWFIEADENDSLEIRVQSFAVSDISLPGGDTFYKNDDQTTLDFGDDLLTKACILRSVSDHVYDKVVCRGERTGLCMTFTADDLKADWRSADEDAYKAGASSQSDYDGLGPQGQWYANQFAREKFQLRRVYSYFTLPNSWNSDPAMQDDWAPGLRFHHKLPLRMDYDYSGDAIINNGPDPLVPLDGHPEYLEPFAFVRDGDSGSDPYKLLSKLSGNVDMKGALERHFDVHMRMQQDGPGVVLHVGGVPQYFIAGDDFNPESLDADADESAQFQYGSTKLDYHNFKYTLFLITDGYAEGEFDDNSHADLFETKVINIPGARLDYVAPNTVVEIKEDGTAVTSSGGYVRDDTDLLNDIARICWEWYSRQREAMDLAVHSLTPAVSLGQMVTKIGSGDNEQTLNTVVTQITFDTRQNSHMVRTAFAELDGASLAPEWRKLLGRKR